MKVEEFLNVVCRALNRSPNSLSLDDNPGTVEEWDSLGHLAIISVIDETLKVPINDDELRDFASLRELVDRLKKRNALED